MEKTDENIKIPDDNELIQIADYNESNVRSELLKYLDNENNDINNEKENILNKYLDSDVNGSNIKGSNAYDNLGVNNFKDEKTEISKHFKSDSKENYSIDPIPSNKSEFELIKNKTDNLSKDQIFGDVVAYDDFDENYASFDK